MAGNGRSGNKKLPVASGRFYQVTVAGYNPDKAALNPVLCSTVPSLTIMALLAAM